MFQRTVEDSWIQPSLVFSKEKKEDTRRRLTRVTRVTKVTRAILLPHAGFLYSGRVLTSTLQSSFPSPLCDVIVMLCANHFAPQSSFTFEDNVNRLGGFAQGVIPILTPLLHVKRNNAVMQREHSWQVDLMALHEAGNRLVATVERVPHCILLIGRNYLQLLPDLLQWLRFRFLSPFFIVSSDFTHYGPGYDYTAFSSSGKQEKKSVIEQVIHKDMSLVAHNFAHPTAFNTQTVCGWYAIALWLKIQHTLYQESRFKLVKYDMSNPKTQDFVTYVGAKWDQSTLSVVARIPRLALLGLFFNIRKLATVSTLSSLAEPKRLVEQVIKKSSLLQKYIHYLEFYHKAHPRFGVFVTFRESQPPNLLQGCLGIFADQIEHFYREHAPAAPTGSNATSWTFCHLIVYYTFLTLFQDTRFKTEEVPLREFFLEGSQSNARQSNARQSKTHSFLTLLTKYDLSITLLSPSFLTLNFWADYVPGRHGIIWEISPTTTRLEATFLPSVMVEEKWVSPQDVSRGQVLGERNRLLFQRQVFTSLLNKMGLGLDTLQKLNLNLDDPHFAYDYDKNKMRIRLYLGTEFHDFAT